MERIGSKWCIATSSRPIAFWKPTGRVKVGDFGLASRWSRNKANLTRTGSFLHSVCLAGTSAAMW